MRHRTPPRLRKLAVAISLFLFATRAISAQTGGGIDLRWHVLSGGGASLSSGGNVALGGSLGQFGTGQSSGGAVNLTGGFWNPGSSAPLAVTLAGFSAVQQGDTMLVAWETASELDNLGFNLYRGVHPSGPDRQLNTTLIPSQSPGSSGGYAYTWEDRADLLPGATYFYWVEDVDIHGAATRHGPVGVTFMHPTAVRLANFAAERPANPSGPALAATLLLLLLCSWQTRRRRGQKPISAGDNQP